MTATAKPDAGYLAALAHRLSGLALAVFLPAHFTMLGLALDETGFNTALKWAENPLVKLAEWGLVVLLALHLSLGLRVLLLEYTPWRGQRLAAIAAGGLFSALIGLVLALEVLL